jgi:hypothetical protein
MARLEDVILIDTRGNQPAATTVSVGTLFCVTDEGDIVERSNGTTWDAYSPTPGAGGTTTIGITVDGAGTALTTGVKGYVQVPFACTITANRMFADQSGSVVIDVWKDVYANFPPTDADSITASAPPTISGAVKSEDATLTGWTTAISAGDILGFNVDSATTITRVTLQLVVTT